MTPTINLYHYWRSSCSWRIRWALEHKGIPYKGIAVDLLSGEQLQKEFLKKNPAGFVPVLEMGGQTYGESFAILEMLEECFPQQPLLPTDPSSRALVRQLCMAIVAGIQPIQNLRVQKYYSNDPGARLTFAQHWIESGFKVYEKLIEAQAGTYSFGGQLTLADLCLIPQVYNALRFNVELSQFPLIKAIYDRCLQLPDCAKSSPESQPGAPK